MTQRRLTFFNEKGGVGKTTSTLNVAIILANEHKKRVLLADLDPQRNLTQALIGEPKNVYTAMDLMTEVSLTRNYTYIPETYTPFTLDDLTINVRDNIDLIPASDAMYGCDIKFADTAGREYLLKNGIDRLADGYDYVIFDCPATFGVLTENCFCNDVDIYIPMECSIFSVEGFKSMIERVKTYVKKAPKLNIKGLFITAYDKRLSLSKFVVINARKNMREMFIDATIRQDVKVKESPIYKQGVTEYSPKCRGSLDYTRLTKIVAEG